LLQELAIEATRGLGTTPAAIDACLAVADRFDVQVAIHTDTINESGFGRVKRSPPSQGERSTRITPRRRGGHAPDIISIASQPNVLLRRLIRRAR